MSSDANTPTTLPGAIAWHVGRLLTFRHDGRGLPAFGSTMLIFLAVLKHLLGVFAVHEFFPEYNGVQVFLQSLLISAFLYVNARYSRSPASFSAYLLLWASMDAFLLLLALFVPVSEAFASFMYVWGFIAFGALLFRSALLDKKNGN